MEKKAFLMNFRKAIPFDEETVEQSEVLFSEEEQMNVFANGEVAWNARTRKYPTNCHTAGHMLKAGYTRSGKWRAAKWMPGKTDRRAGK
jgi:hypothetical protein